MKGRGCSGWDTCPASLTPLLCSSVFSIGIQPYCLELQRWPAAAQPHFTPHALGAGGPVQADCTNIVKGQDDRPGMPQNQRMLYLLNHYRYGLSDTILDS